MKSKTGEGLQKGPRCEDDSKPACADKSEPDCGMKLEVTWNDALDGKCVLNEAAVALIKSDSSDDKEAAAE